MSNTITAYFKGRVGVCESLYQYDYGMVLVLDGIELDPAFEAYYETSNSEEAIPVIGQNNRVAVPNDCLSRSGKVTLHIPVHEGQNDSEVEYIVSFKVIGRARPVDDGDTSQLKTAISQAIALLQHPNAVLDKKLNNLNSRKVNKPVDDSNLPYNGQPGQMLRTKGDGTTEWVDVGLPTNDQTAEAVAAWLNEHPEATSSVQDGSLTETKFSDELRLKTLNDYVTPEMYGAKGDGVTDDIESIRSAIASGKPVYFGKSYYISEPITLTNGATLIGGETYGYKINIKTSTGAFILNDDVRAVTIKGLHFEAQEDDETFFDFTANSARHIHMDGIRVDGYSTGINVKGTMWDCSFKNMRFESSVTSTDFYVETGHNCFNNLFESVYFGNGGIIEVNNYSGTFINCNFGLFQDNQVRFTGKTNILFISCNFECEQFLTNAIPVRFGTGRFTIEGCSFVENGDSSSAMIRTSSSTWLLKITNSIISNKSNANEMGILPTNYIEAAFPGSIQVDDHGISSVEYSGAYKPFSPVYPFGIPKSSDSRAYPRSTMRFNPELNEIQYTPDGTNWIDALGNTENDSTVIGLPNGWYLEFGQVTVNGSGVSTIQYARQRDGYVFVSIPETEETTDIISRIDVNDRAGTYCVVRHLMYNRNDHTWEPNNKSFKYYWAKISR